MSRVFLSWDWRPAVFERSTRRAAAVLEGSSDWTEVDAEDVIHTGRLLPEGRFRDWFGELPPLPGWLDIPSRSEAELARIRTLEEEQRRLYSEAIARLGPEWKSVLEEAAAGGRPPKVYSKRSSAPMSEASQAAQGKVAEPSGTNPEPLQAKSKESDPFASNSTAPQRQRGNSVE
jgi:hypothetical protein